MRKTVRMIQIIVVALGLLTCVFFIGLHKKTQGNENDIVNAVDKTQIVMNADQR